MGWWGGRNGVICLLRLLESFEGSVVCFKRPLCFLDRLLKSFMLLLTFHSLLFLQRFGLYIFLLSLPL